MMQETPRTSSGDGADYIQALIDSHEEETTEPFWKFMIEEHIRNLQAEIANFKKSLD